METKIILATNNDLALLAEKARKALMTIRGPVNNANDQTFFTLKMAGTLDKAVRSIAPLFKENPLSGFLERDRAQYNAYQKQMYREASENIACVIAHFTKERISDALDRSFKDPHETLQEISDILQTMIQLIREIRVAEREPAMQALLTIPEFADLPLFKQDVITIYTEMKNSDIHNALSKKFIDKIIELKKELRNEKI